MPQLSTYPKVTTLAAEDSFLINEPDVGAKQIEFQDLAANLSLPTISGIVPMSKGGTGANMVSPGQDSILFWDNSAAGIKFLSIGDGLQIVGSTLSNTVVAESGGGGAPTTATYLVQVPNAELTAEFAMSTLATGLLKNTTGTGVQTIAVAGLDYAVGPSSSGNNNLVRFNGTGGGNFKDSNVSLSDAATAFVFSGAAGLTASGSNQNINLTTSGTGTVNLSSSLKTAAPSAGPASAIRLGQITTGAVSLDTSRYLLIQVDGATIKVLVAP